MASTKRKSIVDTADISKRARLWLAEGLDGLSTFFGLKPVESLVIEQQRRRQDWVGAYPDLSGCHKERYVRGVLVKQDQDQGQQFPAHHRVSTLSLSSSGSRPGLYNRADAVAAAATADGDKHGKPYQLEPYTKPPSFTAPDFRERSTALRPLSPSPSVYGRQRLESPMSPEEEIREPDSHHPSSSTAAASSVAFHRFTSLHPSSRFGGVSQYNKYGQSSLLRARPRIYASKAQRTTSLLQSKFNKDESIARQRLFDHHHQIHPKPEQNRLQAALDATIGALRSDRGSYVSSRRTSQPNIEDEIAEHRRIRAYNRSYDKDDWQFERSTASRQPAWLRTKYQGDREPSWLKNVRTLINRNLPSIEKQPRPSGYQAIMNEHERIEKELKTRRSGQDQFPPLSKEDEGKIAAALADGHGPVVEGFNVSLLKKDIHTLRPGQWLNDEVINFYGSLIMTRSKESTTLPKVHVFSTFFYKTLSESGYDKVRRWTKKVKLFEMDYVLIPIHRSGNHWTTAVIDMKNKRVEYYDSLLGNNPKCFLILRDYLESESQDKLKKPFDFQGWENDCPKEIPTQRNGFDCGVFTCTFIEFKSRGADDFGFSQDNMPYLRKKITLNIINKSL